MIILKHEFLKIIKNKKLLASIILLPIVLTLLISFMGSASTEKEKKNKTFDVYVVANKLEKSSFEVNDSLTVNIIPTDETDYQKIVDTVDMKNSGVLVINDSIEYYYDTTSRRGEKIGELLKSSFESEYYYLINNKTINMVDVKQNEEKQNAAVLMLPYMLVLNLVAVVSSFATNMIAEEKENKTFSKILLTPIKSYRIIFSKSICAMVCGIISATIYISSYYFENKFLFKNDSMEMISIDLNKLVLIILISLFISILIANIGVICSLLAKNIKEAKSYISPLIIICSILGMMSYFRVGTVNTNLYALPIYNFCILLQDILLNNMQINNFIMYLLSICFLIVLSIFILLYSMQKEEVRN